MRPDLDILYRENARRLAALAYQMTGDHALAEDVVQETFVAAHRALSSFRGEAEPATWLYRIAIRAAIRLREQARRTPTGPVAAAGSLGASESPSDRAHDRRADVEELRLALDALSEDHRVVLSLMNLRDLPVAQVAAVLGVPEGTVWSRASAARRAVRAWIEQRERTHTNPDGAVVDPAPPV